MKFNTEIFIEKSKLIHGDKYDYSLTIYKNNKSKVKIRCPIHGIFEQTAYCHYYFKQGCPECKPNKQYTTDEFVQKCKKIHGDKYNYSLVSYKNAYTKVDIICEKHGIFSVRPSDHLNGVSCSLCSLGFIKNNKISTEEFIIKANKVHNNMYNYSKTIYKNSRSKLIITCKEHGDFLQKAESHLRGRGCPNCIKSTGENKIESYLTNNNILLEKQKKFESCKNVLNLSFDFYLPDYNICIEYDGIQHFEPVKYFGGLKELINRQKLDKIKNEYCQNNNIHLIRINYKENIEEKLDQELINFLNSSALF